MVNLLVWWWYGMDDPWMLWMSSVILEAEVSYIAYFEECNWSMCFIPFVMKQCALSCLFAWILCPWSSAHCRPWMRAQQRTLKLELEDYYEFPLFPKPKGILLQLLSDVSDQTSTPRLECIVLFVILNDSEKIATESPNDSRRFKSITWIILTTRIQKLKRQETFISNRWLQNHNVATNQAVAEPHSYAKNIWTPKR